MPTLLDYELYGLNPAVAGPASDPGAYNVFNGALTEFDDAYNVELFSLLNPTAAIDTIPMADLFGSTSDDPRCVCHRHRLGRRHRLLRRTA